MENEALPTNTARLGAVEMEEVNLTQFPRLEDSPEFNDITTKLKAGQQITEALQQRGDVKLDVLLTSALDQLVEQSRIAGLMIASDDGFPIAQSSNFRDASVLAALGCLFQLSVRRAQSEGVLEAVEELTLRAFSGEQVMIRFVRATDRNYFLVAYAQRICPYRRATAKALDYCSNLLKFATAGGSEPRLPSPRRDPKFRSLEQGA